MTTADTPVEPSPRQQIVVGIDGSPNAHRALSWAYSEAEQRGADLDVIIAWDFPYKWAEGFNAEWGADADYFAKLALDEAAEAVDQLLDGKARPAWLHVHAVEGPAAPVLLDHAKRADLLVVGSRGRGGFAKLLLGSVSSACAHHATCPVAVIPEP